MDCIRILINTWWLYQPIQINKHKSQKKQKNEYIWIYVAFLGTWMWNVLVNSPRGNETNSEAERRPGRAGVLSGPSTLTMRTVTWKKGVCVCVCVCVWVCVSQCACVGACGGRGGRAINLILNSCAYLNCEAIPFDNLKQSTCTPSWLHR